MEANPFTTSPLQSGLYVTESLAAILAKIRYVLDARQGLTVVYGEVGLGKTSLLRHLNDEYAARDDCETAIIPTPAFKTDTALLRAVCAEFGLPIRRSMLDQESELRSFLVGHYAEGRNCVLFLDEAQIMPGRVLELIRLLLNLDMDKHKLLQIVLAGQLELRDRLRDPTKKALRSRIFITSTLDPLTLDETSAMIAHRCTHVGAKNPFPAETVEAIWARAGGVPRETLKLCGITWEISRQSGYKTVPVEAVEHIAPDIEAV